MSAFNARPVQAFIPHELHLALKLRAVHEDKTIASIVRDLIAAHCRSGY
jgi:hypothetical protein